MCFNISSLSGWPEEKYARLTKGNWAIENGPHWQLDVTFGEDAS
jgi:predicted transposase YbfD/YdcC